MERIWWGLHLVLVVIGLAGSAAGQAAELTSEERRAAIEFRERFAKRINEVSGLESLVAEMFVTDFADRWVKEAKAQRKPNDNSPVSVGVGITYLPKVLDTGAVKDWRELHLATFDLMRVAVAATMNQMGAAYKNHQKPDDADIDAAVQKAFPPSVSGLLSKDPILTNFIALHTKQVPIATAADLTRVARTMRRAAGLMEKDAGRSARQFSPDAITMLEQVFERAGDGLGPWLAVAERETFGFPKGTRLITFFASPNERLTIVKVGSEYKIVEAAMSTPE